MRRVSRQSKRTERRRRKRFSKRRCREREKLPHTHPLAPNVNSAVEVEAQRALQVVVRHLAGHDGRDDLFIALVHQRTIKLLPVLLPLPALSFLFLCICQALRRRVQEAPLVHPAHWCAEHAHSRPLPHKRCHRRMQLPLYQIGVIAVTEEVTRGCGGAGGE